MNTPSPGDPLGYDVLVDEHDLDPTGRSATGEELVLAAIPHRLTCERLPMIGAPDDYVPFGIDVRLWVGEATTAADLTGKIPLADEALQRDERIASTSIAIDFAPAGTTFDDGATVTLIMRVTFTTVTGVTLSRVLGISAVTVAFLAQVP